MSKDEEINNICDFCNNQSSCSHLNLNLFREFYICHNCEKLTAKEGVEILSIIFNNELYNLVTKQQHDMMDLKRSIDILYMKKTIHDP
jgi:hypothetical protein